MTDTRPAPLDMTISFVTNRNVLDVPVNGFGTSFNAKSPAELRFGTVTVDAGANVFRSTAEVEAYLHEALADGHRPWKLQVYPDPVDATDADSRKQAGSRLLFEELKGHMKTKARDTMVYVHGFNTTFDKAIVSGIAMQWYLRTQAHRTSTDGANVTVFSWPSNGRLLEYFADRDDAAHSGTAFARAFVKLREFVGELTGADQCNRRLHLLAHSMGNFVLERALPAIRYRGQGSRLPQLFDEVLLVAPDVDVDAFEHTHKLGRLPDLAKRVSLYVHSRDKALWTSDKTKGNPDRLGRDGPANRTRVVDKVDVVDLTGDVTSDRFSHNYQTDHVFLDDVANTLAGRHPTRHRPAPRVLRPGDNRWELP